MLDSYPLDVEISSTQMFLEYCHGRGAQHLTKQPFYWKVNLASLCPLSELLVRKAP